MPNIGKCEICGDIDGLKTRDYAKHPKEDHFWCWTCRNKIMQERKAEMNDLTNNLRI
jgi:hypothetical protein